MAAPVVNVDEDRAVGCLLGLACGDALGGPVEFRSREEIAREFPEGVRDFVGGGWLGLAPGEVTDDTQLTLAVGAALVEEGFDPLVLTRELLTWYRSGPKDIGNTTRAALAALAEGTAWRDVGPRAMKVVGDRSASNGALMRSAPVALRFRLNPAQLDQVSMDAARVTHADPRCLWSAVALNRAIAVLLNGGSPTKALAVAAAVTEPETRRALLAVAEKARDSVRSTGYVLDTLGAAFWCLLHHDDFEETIVAAVGFGDDADTTGAVAGALAGARYGAATIPRRWLDRLERRSEIERLARRLLDLSDDGGRQSSRGYR